MVIVSLQYRFEATPNAFILLLLQIQPVWFYVYDQLQIS